MATSFGRGPYKVKFWITLNVLRRAGGCSVEIAHGASAGAARVAATAAWTCRRSSRRSFRGHGKHRKLRRELLAVAFGTLGFVAAENERLKLVLAVLANVLENRHGLLPENANVI